MGSPTQPRTLIDDMQLAACIADPGLAKHTLIEYQDKKRRAYTAISDWYADNIDSRTADTHYSFNDVHELLQKVLTHLK